MKIISKHIILLLIIFGNLNSYGQKNTEFNTTKEYLEYVYKKFKIPSSEIYYLSTKNDSLNIKLEKYGIVVFITDNNISTVQEVAEELKSQCSPKYLLPKITNDAIIKASSPSEASKKIILKNLNDGKQLNLENNKLAIYTFSHRFGNNAKLFYNEKNELEKLGYKTIVLSIDGAYIKELNDIDKTPVYIQ
ncbi:hypothetical protein [Flavobacterium sasangense]|uniref:hypothetical protein n=1 Tax=Flavobacterium sasangense TaxID=503361 RepID=UPI0004788069|nr:hypothetical protein [Flavobacterium sasangense]